MGNIVIVEDELIVARDIALTIERAGYKVDGIARSVDKALPLIQEHKPWIVLLDIFLKGDLTGIDLARELMKMGIPFIYVSANGNQNVLEAVKPTNPVGFIVKPFREKDLLVTLQIARYRVDAQLVLNRQSSSSASETAVSLPARANHFPGAGISSPVMADVVAQARRVAPSDSSVLLLGESGTGKEVIANYIVELSRRRGGPFIKVNCGAIPRDLMEAELFGYEKGAFTGAASKHKGKFESAHGGTILLDEIGEMSLDMQSKLLRVLQEREIQPLGRSASIKIDVRIIAATSRILEREVAEGRFRLDLYYRLYVFPILLPPLRERKEDIEELAMYFLNKLSPASGKSINGFSEKALNTLLMHHWPGNVRELEHVVERSILLCEGQNIDHVQLPAKDGGEPRRESGANPEIKSLDEHEREHILEVLQKTNGRVDGPSGAASMLKISPSTLYSKMKKLKIKVSY